MTPDQAQQRAERIVNQVDDGFGVDMQVLAKLIAAALLAVQRETREACAALCDSLGADDTKPTDRVIGYEEAADVIREGQHEAD